MSQKFFFGNFALQEYPESEGLQLVHELCSTNMTYKVRPLSVGWSSRVKGNPVFEGPITGCVFKTRSTEEKTSNNMIFIRLTNTVHVGHCYSWHWSGWCYTVFLHSSWFTLQHIAVCEITSRGCYRILESVKVTAFSPKRLNW